MMKGRISRHVVFLVVALLFLWTNLGDAQPQGELRVAIPWTPENLDPTMNLSSFRAMVGVSMFDSLVGRDTENRIVPQLAESWRFVDDVTLQLKLRKGVVFHDGEPFNAEAVRFTFQRVLDPEQKSPNRANVAEIARIDIVDDYTVNLITRQPYAPLVNRLIDFAIVPPKYVQEKGNQGIALKPVGTGPYRFVELIKDDRMVVEAFDRHWRGTPKIKRIIYKPIPEPFTRAAALRNNEVDLVTTIPPSLARELEKAPGIRVQRVPSTWIIYLGLNALKKPLSDVRVRQALNYATDVDAIIKSVLEGNGRRLDGPLAPQMFGYDASVKGYTPDPGKAPKAPRGGGLPGRPRDHPRLAGRAVPGRQGDRGSLGRPVAKGRLQAQGAGGRVGRLLQALPRQAVPGCVHARPRRSDAGRRRALRSGPEHHGRGEAAADLPRPPARDDRGRDLGLPAPAGGHLREPRPTRLDAAPRSVDAAPGRHAQVAALLHH